jgi:hypothetical protein
MKDPMPDSPGAKAAPKQSQLFMIPSKPQGKGTPVAGKPAPARSAKQARKEIMRVARAALQNTVPAKGRGVFKDCSKIDDS